MSKAKRCWIVTDGRAGIENQALGLAEALARLTPIELSRKVIAVQWPWRAAPRFFWGDPFSKLSSAGSLLRPPYPDIWIGCGRLSVPLTMAVKRQAPETFTVQLQNPRARHSAFDLVIPPSHDAIAGENIFSILGAPNRITPALLEEEARDAAPLVGGLSSPRVAVLIGGTNADNVVTRKQARRLLDALETLVRGGAALMITYSRRTPATVRELIDPFARDRDGVFLWDGETAFGAANPYLGILAQADHVIVTGDSVNMATDAGAAGKPVHIFFWEGDVSNVTKKFRRFFAALFDRGVARPFSGDLTPWDYEPLNETTRAAAELEKRFIAASPAPTGDKTAA
ncbi:MAG: mitochondrial fission ELM1 family protein [Pseudomonadota bacterium]